MPVPLSVALCCGELWMVPSLGIKLAGLLVALTLVWSSLDTFPTRPLVSLDVGLLVLGLGVPEVATLKLRVVKWLL